MALASSDLLLVERSNTVYKETFGNRANIDDTDLILVERSNTLYKCAWSDWDDGGGGGGGSGGGGIHGWASGTGAYTPTMNFNYTTSTADSTTAYSVLGATMSVTGGDNSGTCEGNLYLGLRMRGSTSYFHDLCVSHVQILSSSTTYRTDSSFPNGYDWAFGNTSNSSGCGEWQRASSISTWSTDPSTLTYDVAGSFNVTNGLWSRASGTGSSNTGAADGTYSPSVYSGGGGSIIQSTGTVGQEQGSYFLYTETSGSGWTIGTSALWLKSPTITVSNGDYLRMLYCGVGGSSSSNGLGAWLQNAFYLVFK